MGGSTIFSAAGDRSWTILARSPAGASRDPAADALDAYRQRLPRATAALSNAVILPLVAIFTAPLSSRDALRREYPNCDRCCRGEVRKRHANPH